MRVSELTETGQIRRKTDGALKASVDRYEALFHDSPIPLWEEDFSGLNAYIEDLRAGGVSDLRDYFQKNPSELHGCVEKIKILDVNRAAIELHEASDKISLLSNPGKIFTEKSYEVLTEEIIAITTGASEYMAEAQVKTLAGEPRDISLRLRMMSDKPGCHKALLATIDITERKRTEQTLRETRERLEEAQKIAGLGYYVFNVRSGTWINSTQLNDIFGIDEAYKRDVQGWLDIVHPDCRETMSMYLRDDVLSRGNAFDREYRIINVRNGEERWVHGLGGLKFDENGNPTEMFGTIQDITARKRAEYEAWRETETTNNLLRLSDVTCTIADIEELMKNVVYIVRDIIKVDVVLSYLWDSDSKTLRPQEAVGLADTMLPIFRSMPLSLENERITGAMDSGRVLIDDVDCVGGPVTLKNAGFYDLVDNPRISSLLPLVGKREYQGLIVCLCSGGSQCGDNYFTERNRDLLQTVANQVSVALEEARHYRESISRGMELARKVLTIETISNISKAILSTLDVKTIMGITASMVSRLVPCDLLRIIEVDRGRSELKLTAGFEKNKTLRSFVMPFTSSSMTTVLYTRRPEYIADLAAVVSPLPIERDLIKEGYLSVLRIPIIVKAEVCGVLGLMSRRVSAFSPTDLATLEGLSSHVGVALANARLLRDLEEFSIGTIGALARSIDAKSPWTHGHSERVTEISLRIGTEIGLGAKELNDLRIAGLLHDIGKIGTYESILNKHGKLTEGELREIRKHPVKGAEILTPIRQLTHLLPTIRGHHEFFDGRGYPDGLKGEDIPLNARILAVADTVDAMRSDRPYRRAMPEKKNIAELKRCSDMQFDRSIVDAYLRTVA